MIASYVLRIPQAGVLPAASSRPRLTVAALAVQLMVPVIRVHRGLSPPSMCALTGAPKKKAVPEIRHSLQKNPVSYLSRDTFFVTE